MRPIAIDLACGLGGWTEGLIAAGWDCIGFDIERHDYGEGGYPGQLVLQDILTLHGSQFRNVGLIVASPPCQFFSYCAMPWGRAKALAAEVRADPDRLSKELGIFNACFRIQREACEAAGRHIPLVVENVRGAIPWVGRSRWNFGSYHLWGDVPALMPQTMRRTMKNGDGGSWFGLNPDGSPGALNNARDGKKVPGFRFDGSGRSFQTASVEAHEGVKNPGRSLERGEPRFNDRIANFPAGLKPPARVADRDPSPGRKSVGSGAVWFDQNIASLPSASPRRKAASAKIAKIPRALSEWIGRTYFPREFSHGQG